MSPTFLSFTGCGRIRYGFVTDLTLNDTNGVSTAEWDASGFASGVYYYRIVANNFIETKKLIQLK